MRILALETSAKAVSAAVSEDGVLRCSAYQNSGLTHSVTLMPMVSDMLKNASLTMDDIHLIAVAAGPGSFTGLRIGVSAAKGLAWAKQLPCCGVSTTEAMAMPLRGFCGIIVCAMDARRQQVYNAFFRSENGILTRLCDDRAIALEQVAAELAALEGEKLVVGDGASLCCDYLQQQGIPCRLAPPECRFQSAAGVAFAAEAMAARGETVSAQELVPNYLRLSQAERERLEKGLPITLD